MNTNTKAGLPVSVLTPKQVKNYGPKAITYCGERAFIRAKVRHDDECGNGHNTFAITGEIYTTDKRRSDPFLACGCLHEEIAKHFPELAPFIKWHLMGTDEPLHYVANTVYHAGDRDCWGLRKGEFRQHTSRGKYQADGVEGVPCWELKFPEGQAREIYSHEKPGPVTLEWQPYGKIGEGKERELDLARSSAVWPEATDEQLMQEPAALKAALEARLPALMADFKRDVESLGFIY